MILELLLALSLSGPLVDELPESAVYPLTSEAVELGPILVVEFPKTVKDRQLVKIDASKSDADEVLFDFDDAPIDSFRPEGWVAFFAAQPGEHRIVVRAAKTVNGKAKQERQVVTLNVPGAPKPPPVDPPPPIDPPTEPPVTPPTPIGLTAAVKGYVKLVTADPHRTTTAKALALTYRTWAKIGANAKDPQEFVRGSNMVIDGVLKQTGKADAWKPFLAALDMRLMGMAMTTISEHQDAWKKIADGLETP